MRKQAQIDRIFLLMKSKWDEFDIGIGLLTPQVLGEGHREAQVEDACRSFTLQLRYSNPKLLQANKPA
jgi:hypothetical protein